MGCLRIRKEQLKLMNEVGLPSRWTKHHLLLHTSGLFFPSWFLIPEINKSNICQLKKNYFNRVNYFIFSLYSSLFNFHVLIAFPCLFRGKMVMKKKFLMLFKKSLIYFYFWPCRVSAAACGEWGLLLAAPPRTWCFSWGTGSERAGFSRCDSRA